MHASCQAVEPGAVIFLAVGGVIGIFTTRSVTKKTAVCGVICLKAYYEIAMSPQQQQRVVTCMFKPHISAL
jgi:hypothetical protein